MFQPLERSSSREYLRGKDFLRTLRKICGSLSRGKETTMKSTTSWELTQRKGWEMRGLPLTQILCSFYKLLACIFHFTLKLCHFLWMSLWVPRHSLVKTQLQHSLESTGCLGCCGDWKEFQGRGEMSTSHPFLLGRSLTSTTHYQPYEDNWQGRSREVGDLDTGGGQHVGQAGRKAPHQERRPENSEESTWTPRVLEDGKCCKNGRKTFVLRKRGGNWNFPFSTLFKLPCFRAPKFRQVPWALEVNNTRS